jgi:O-antigen/teichoic acid export membrane protein
MINLFDRRLIRTASIFFCLQILNYLFPLLIIPVLASRLGLNSYGVVVFHQTICSQLIIFAEWGFLWSSTREIASNFDNESIVSKVFTLSLLAQVFVSLFAALSIYGYFLVFDCANLKYVNFYLLMLAGNLLYVQWLFQGTENMSHFLLAQFVSKAFTLFSVLLFITRETDTFLYLLLFGISHFVGGSLAFYIAIKRKIHKKFAKVAIGETLSFMWEAKILFAARMISSISANSPTLLLGMMSSSENVAIFSLADKVRLACQSMFSPLMQALAIKMNLRFKIDLEAAMKEFLLSFRLLVFISLLLVATVILFAELIIEILGGGHFNHAINVLKIIAPLIVLVNASNAISGQFLIPRGLYGIYGKALFFSNLISVPLIAALIFYINIYGAAVGIVCAEILILIAFLAAWKMNSPR